MKYSFILILVLFLSIVSAQGQLAIGAEEYRIYQAILNEDFIGASSTNLVIFRSTQFESINNRRGMLAEAGNDTIKSYLSRGRVSSELSDVFGVQPNVRLITEDDLVSVWREDRADLGDSFKRAFLAKFSSDFSLKFSRVGFSKKADKALVHVGYTCGTTCGEGNFYVLEMRGGWKVKKKIRTWIS